MTMLGCGQQGIVRRGKVQLSWEGRTMGNGICLGTPICPPPSLLPAEESSPDDDVFLRQGLKHSLQRQSWTGRWGWENLPSIRDWELSHISHIFNECTWQSINLPVFRVIVLLWINLAIFVLFRWKWDNFLTKVVLSSLVFSGFRYLAILVCPSRPCLTLTQCVKFLLWIRPFKLRFNPIKNNEILFPFCLQLTIKLKEELISLQ